jgi:Spy/CpxP family protein refolding chaperone
MKKFKLMIGIALAAALVASVAIPAVARRGGEGREAWGGRRAWGGQRERGPQFTVEQQEQMEKIHEKYDDERVELANRLKVIGLEMREIVAADGEPDFDAIEAKMEDAAEVRLELAKLRLRIHKEIRPLLTDDQRTLFDARMGRFLTHVGPGGRGGYGMGHGRMGRRMGHDLGTRGRAGGRMGRGMGGRTGPEAWCPWVSEPVQPDVEEIE